MSDIEKRCNAAMLHCRMFGGDLSTGYLIIMVRDEVLSALAEIRKAGEPYDHTDDEYPRVTRMVEKLDEVGRRYGREND